MMMTTLLLILNFASASMTHYTPDIEAPSWRYKIPAPLSLQSQDGAMLEPWEAMRTIGSRNLEWLRLLNANLPADQKIDLYPVGSMKGISIEDPLRYNDAILNT